MVAISGSAGSPAAARGLPVLVVEQVAVALGPHRRGADEDRVGGARAGPRSSARSAGWPSPTDRPSPTAARPRPTRSWRRRRAGGRRRPLAQAEAPTRSAASTGPPAAPSGVSRSPATTLLLLLGLGRSARASRPRCGCPRVGRRHGDRERPAAEGVLDRGVAGDRGPRAVAEGEDDGLQPRAPAESTAPGKTVSTWRSRRTAGDPQRERRGRAVDAQLADLRARDLAAAVGPATLQRCTPSGMSISGTNDVWPVRPISWPSTNPCTPGRPTARTTSPAQPGARARAPALARRPDERARRAVVAGRHEPPVGARALDEDRDHVAGAVGGDVEPGRRVDRAELGPGERGGRPGPAVVERARDHRDGGRRCAAARPAPRRRPRPSPDRRARDGARVADADRRGEDVHPQHGGRRSAARADRWPPSPARGR